MLTRAFGTWCGLTLALLLPVALSAQGIAFEVRGGTAVPLGALIEHDAEFGDAAGLSFGGGLAVALTPQISLSGGFSRHAFGCQPTCELSSTGFEIGARLQLPLALPVTPWLTAGALFHEMRLRERDPNAETVHFVTDNAPGLQLGGGIGVPLTGQVMVMPGIRFNRYRVTTMLADELGAPLGEREHRPQYLTLEVGLRFTP